MHRQYSSSGILSLAAAKTSTHPLPTAVTISNGYLSSMLSTFKKQRRGYSRWHGPASTRTGCPLIPSRKHGSSFIRLEQQSTQPSAKEKLDSGQHRTARPTNTWGASSGREPSFILRSTRRVRAGGRKFPGRILQLLQVNGVKQHDEELAASVYMVLSIALELPKRRIDRRWSACVNLIGSVMHGEAHHDQTALLATRANFWFTAPPTTKMKFSSRLSLGRTRFLHTAHLRHLVPRHLLLLGPTAFRVPVRGVISRVCIVLVDAATIHDGAVAAAAGSAAAAVAAGGPFYAVALSLTAARRGARVASSTTTPLGGPRWRG